jgi:hypothetical protein
MHRFERWRDVIQAAPDERAIHGLMRDYVQVIPPILIAALPRECQRALGEPDIQSAAVTILHCELNYRGEPATAELLHEIAHTFAAASMRISRFGPKPGAA